MLLKICRNALGMIIVFIDWVSRPKATVRSEEAQAKAHDALNGHSLYQFMACPFCIKTRRAIHKLGVNVDLRDINKTPQYRAELEAGGGHVQVPCLRIEDQGQVRWMYESNDIIKYLEQRLASI